MLKSNKSNKKRILYFSCHQILEYDDIRMLTDAGHDVFSVGDFIAPQSAKTYLRKPPSAFFNEDLCREFINTGCNLTNRTVTPTFVRFFDIIIINHYILWYEINKLSFGDKPVVIRTIGQSTRSDERAYKALNTDVKIVRYSDNEVGLPGFARTDAVIRVAKYPADYPEWKGGKNCLRFHNHYTDRDGVSCPTPSAFRYFQARAASHLYGAGNENFPRSNGLAESEEMPVIFQNASTYFYVCSLPPSYTLSFMEAMFAGCPIIAPSAKYIKEALPDALFDFFWTEARYEIPEILDGGCGVVYDTIKEAVYAEHWLKAWAPGAKQMSDRVVAKAIELFDVKHIAPKWNALFDRIC